MEVRPDVGALLTRASAIFRSSQPSQVAVNKARIEIALITSLGWGRRVDWFVKQGVILGGIPIQNWMLLAIAIILLSVCLISWWCAEA